MTWRDSSFTLYLHSSGHQESVISEIPCVAAYFSQAGSSTSKRSRLTAEMAVTKEQVESTLKLNLNPSHLDVIDTSGGCGASFSIEIVSEKFEGKRLLERHRLVNAALVEEMKHIHALSITKALTPDQWKQQQEAKNPQAAA